jgi:hypothetical protein
MVKISDKVEIRSLLDFMVFKSRWRIVGYDLSPINYSCYLIWLTNWIS